MGEEDGLAELKPWGLELTGIRVPVQLWHGHHDRFVPSRADRAMHAWLLDHF